MLLFHLMFMKSYENCIRFITALSLVLSQTSVAATLATPDPEPGSGRGLFLNNLVTGKVGEVLPGHTSPEGQSVLFQGERDYLGRERVFSYAGEKDGNPQFRRGTLETNGSLTWDGSQNSRAVGQNRYPNYPEVQGRPIEPGRALVPVGPVRDVPRGSGSAEINSPSTEFLPEFSEAGRPSNLRRTLDWSRSKGEGFRRDMGRILSEAQNSEAMNSALQKSAQGLEKLEQLKAPAAKVGNVAVAFYTAIGFIAAYNLMLNYSNNPVAFEKFIQGLPWNDPIGFAALVGFMAGAAWFYKKMGVAAPNGGILKTMPYFAAAMLAGTFISTSVSVIAARPDFQMCTGFAYFKAKGEFKWDIAGGCNGLWDWMKQSDENGGMIREIANGFVPLAANVLAAGGIYLGIVQTAAFISNKYKIVEAIRTLSPVRSAGRGGGAGVAMSVVHMFLFLMAFQASNSIFHVEKSVREFLITEMGLFSHEYGRDMKSAEQNLLAEWALIKKNNFQNPDSWSKVCIDSNRSKNILFDCENPDRLPLPGILGRYAKLQATWRATQMQDTMAAYQQWISKRGQFGEMIDMSYLFYKKHLPIIAQGKFTPELLKAPAPTANKELSELNMDGTWQQVETRRMQDFLLASMACGPEAEGYAATGMWQATRQILKSYVTGNSGPRQVFENKSGFKVSFFPPRLTVPLDGKNDSICERSTKTLPDLFAMRYRTTDFPITIKNWITPDYNGLPSYMKENLRAGVYNPADPKEFDGWWSRNVMSGAMEVQEQLRSEFRELLNGPFKTALTRKDYYWCQGTPVPNTGLEKYMRKLMTASDKCGPQALHRLGYGIVDNLRDELRLYLSLLLDLYISKTKTENQAKAEGILVPKAAAVMAGLEAYARQLSVVDSSQRGNIPEITNKAVDAFNEFNSALYESEQVIGTKMDPHHVKWTEMLMARAQQVFQDSSSYYSILTTFEGGSKGP